MYEFEQAETLNPVFTFSNLQREERELVESVAMWSNPNQFSELIQNVNGRSIEFKSPTIPTYTVEDYLADRFDGLQIYGVGGLTEKVSEGFAVKQSSIKISQVDPHNYAEELADILQQREIDNSGRFKAWNRQYSPFRGMDEPEAENRRTITELLAKGFELGKAKGADSWIRVPIFAAEGIFPDKKDPYGKPLHFQVYRVPLLDRFPGQLASVTNADMAYDYSSKFSYWVGKTYRFLHRNGFAYMNGHFGNMSLITNGGRVKLYITDLGSLHYFSDNAFPERYKGIDFITFLMSSEKLFTMYRGLLEKYSKDNKSAKLFSDALCALSQAAMINGYYQTEIINSIIKPEILNNKITPAIYQAFKTLSTQEFLEFMEKLLQGTCDTRKVGIPVEI